MKTLAVLVTLTNAKDIERGLMSTAGRFLEYQDAKCAQGVTWYGILIAIHVFLIALPLVVMAEAFATLGE